MRPWQKYFLYSIVGVFALIGVTFSAVFIGMHFGVFNVRGSIDERNAFYNDAKTNTLAPGTAKQDAQNSGRSTKATTPSKPIVMCADDAPTCDWNETHEWAVVAGGLAKDKPVIDRVSAQTGVPARIIASIVVPEQTRFFTAERETFKRYFEPLKILGSLSQFSLGVSGIKQTTAEDIEKYANDPKSPFYPGDDIAPLLSYSADADHDQELYDRLSDAKDHYYSYLYTAAFVREIEAQWKSAGFNIADKPGAIVTLFNIGLARSHPNANPELGGAPIQTGGKTYSYGKLGQLFYDSNEIIAEFPR